MKYIKEFKSFKRTDKLSGIVLLVEGKVLLVHAKKHKKSNDMWSFPKGHIEGKPLGSALKELKEETGIKLGDDYENKFTIEYRSGDIRKVLKLYLYRRTIEDVSKYVTTDFKIKKKALKKVDNEIYDVNFFTIEESLKFLQKGQRQVINHLVNY